jgi:hypothetical protein
MPQEVKRALFCGLSGYEFGDALDLEEKGVCSESTHLLMCCRMFAFSRKCLETVVMGSLK